jgi:hypothetical protein
MLKTNVEFWSNVIQTTRQQQQQQQQQQPLEAPLSPLSVASSSSSFQSFHQIKPPQKQEDNDDESEEEEEEDIDELDEDDSMDESLQHHKKKPVNKPVTNNGRKRRGNLPKNVTAILKQWLIDHCRHPYPTEEEKRALRHKTNLTLNQISNWFINARRRILPLILAAPVYRQQSPSPPASTTAADSRTCYKKKMRRKRGWMASSGIVIEND